MISFTFAMAEGVRFTGAVEAGVSVTTSGVGVAVDIGQNLLVY
jgi:hypothetical protein